MDIRETLQVTSLQLRNAAGTFLNTLANATTAARTWTLPDKSGTVALTSDISSEFKNLLVNAGFVINNGNAGTPYVSAAVLAAGATGHECWKAGTGGGDYSFTQIKSNTQITIASGKTLIQVIEDVNVQGTAYVLSWTGTAQARYTVNSATPSGAYASSPIIITGQTAGTTMSVEFNAGTLKNPQLEQGAVVTNFNYRSYASELALTQRYYLTGVGRIFAQNVLSSQQTLTTCYFNTMRATPTVVGTFTYTYNCSSGVISALSSTSLQAYVTATLSMPYVDCPLTFTANARL